MSESSDDNEACPPRKLRRLRKRSTAQRLRDDDNSDDSVDDDDDLRLANEYACDDGFVVDDEAALEDDPGTAACVVDFVELLNGSTGRAIGNQLEERRYEKTSARSAAQLLRETGNGGAVAADAVHSAARDSGGLDVRDALESIAHDIDYDLMRRVLHDQFLPVIGVFRSETNKRHPLVHALARTGGTVVTRELVAATDELRTCFFCGLRTKCRFAVQTELLGQTLGVSGALCAARFDALCLFYRLEVNLCDAIIADDELTRAHFVEHVHKQYDELCKRIRELFEHARRYEARSEAATARQ